MNKLQEIKGIPDKFSAQLVTFFENLKTAEANST